MEVNFALRWHLKHVEVQLRYVTARVTYRLSFEAVCRDPGMPENGTRIGDDFRDGQMVAYRCNPNFNLVGSPTSFCIAGHWNTTKPTCKGKQQKYSRNDGTWEIKGCSPSRLIKKVFLCCEFCSAFLCMKIVRLGLTAMHALKSRNRISFHTELQHKGKEWGIVIHLSFSFNFIRKRYRLSSLERLI